MRAVTSYLAMGVLAASLCAGGAQATPLRFEGVFHFGDSLADIGKTYALTDETFPPSPPYFEGRFSNGPVWAEYISRGFEKRNLPNANFAFGGSKARPDPFPPPDLGEQIGGFSLIAPLVADLDTVATIITGNNDVLQAVERPDIEAVAAEAAEAVVAGAAALHGLGIDHVLLFNMVPLELIPRFTTVEPQFAEQAAKGAEAFNSTLAALTPGLIASGLPVTTIDLNALFLELIADPGGSGYDNATDPCLTITLAGPSICADPDRWVFWDNVHPTAAVHRQIAGIVSAEIAPVPLPLPAALMLSGLFGMIVLRHSGRHRDAAVPKAARV